MFDAGGGGGGGGGGGTRLIIWCAAEMGDFFQKKIPKHAPHFCKFTVDTRYFRPFRR